MKRFTLLAGLIFAMAGQVKAKEISYFDFNTDDGDGATGTFSSRPLGSSGESTDTVIGTSQVINAAYRFQYSANDDPRFFEQSAVRMTTFPGATSANKTSGIEFRVSTLGYEGVTVSYQGYYSSAVSRYWRVQYTADGSTWTDYQVIEPKTAQAWAYYNIDFAGVPAADNNPNFGFRIVAEWQSTATGSGVMGYVGITQGYNTGAQFWVDILKVNGNPIDASNTRPTISSIPTQNTTDGVATAAIPFTVGDAEEASANLTVDWSTTATELVENVTIGGSGANRTIVVTPKAGVVGIATITLKVTDTAGKFVTTSFAVNIRATVPPGVVAYWDFNGAELDQNPSTGTFESRVGDGIAQVMNASYTFAASTTGLDPWSVDDSIVRMINFPAATAGNKTAGMEFRFSTVGYEGLTVQWDHNNSAAGSRYYRAQYTQDGVNWIDHAVVTNALSGWRVHSVDFKGVRAADNNPNFGVRLVTEFESTATGAGAANYVASQGTGNYAGSGTWWVDRVTFSGQPVNAANLAPAIDVSTSATGRVGAASIAIPFTVSDVETPAPNLSVNWSTQTPSKIAGATLSGTGANRTLNVVPSGVEGTAELVLVVTDAGGKYTEARVILTLLPDNTAPTISSLSTIEMFANSTSHVVATIGDLEQDVNSLVLTVESSSPWLLDSNSVVITGSGAERTLAITPVANAAGAAWVTVTVSDGALSSSTSFALKVHQPETIALWNFNSVEADASTATGSLEPAIGVGTISIVGSPTNSFGKVSSPSFDPELDDNTNLRLGSFAQQGTSNKLNGVEFKVSTVGFKNIAVSWDHYNSASASKYWRLQFTVDGVNYTDLLVYTNPVVTTFRPTGTSFNFPEVENNPNFGIRIVSEFESTATRAGLDEYIPVSDTIAYGIAGTLWLDMIRFTGEPAGAAPALQIVRNGNQLEISWPENAVGSLETTDDLGSLNWQAVSATPEIANGRKTVVLPIGPQSRFFRLGVN